jgi:hypothetical protein
MFVDVQVFAGRSGAFALRRSRDLASEHRTHVRPCEVHGYYVPGSAVSVQSRANGSTIRVRQHVECSVDLAISSPGGNIGKEQNCPYTWVHSPS